MSKHNGKKKQMKGQEAYSYALEKLNKLRMRTEKLEDKTGMDFTAVKESIATSILKLEKDFTNQNKTDEQKAYEESAKDDLSEN